MQTDECQQIVIKIIQLCMLNVDEIYERILETLRKILPEQLRPKMQDNYSYEQSTRNKI